MSDSEKKDLIRYLSATPEDDEDSEDDEDPEVEIYIEFNGKTETILCKKSKIPEIQKEYEEKFGNIEIEDGGDIITEEYMIYNENDAMQNEIPVVKFDLNQKISRFLSLNDEFHICQIYGCRNRIIPKKPKFWERLFPKKYSKKLKEYEDGLNNLRELFKINIQRQNTQSAFFCESHKEIWLLKNYNC